MHLARGPYPGQLEPLHLASPAALTTVAEPAAEGCESYHPVLELRENSLA